MPVSVSPQDIRDFANLPSEVPEALLSTHIGIATGDLLRATGLTDPPGALNNVWAEALTVRALASAYPWLNTFTLDGAAKVGRLEGSVEFRFQDSDEVRAKVSDLMKRFDDLVAQIIEQDTQDQDGEATIGSTWMTAI